ncbi:hypothetical protein [Planococcus rifietoensis]|uniref:hypothetical protein n=1 Tax=Planococcus rifietoensis TaxID=200991 RepID=UPI00384C5E84
MKSQAQFVVDYLSQRVSQLEVEKAALLHQLDDAARQVEELKLEAKNIGSEVAIGDEKK